jgi:hypothetical protein
MSSLYSQTEHEMSNSKFSTPKLGSTECIAKKFVNEDLYQTVSGDFKVRSYQANLASTLHEAQLKRYIRFLKNSSLYSAFTDEVERSCHFPAPTGTAVKYVSFFYCLMVRYLTRIGKNLVALGGESCSSSWEPGSDSCVQLYQ